MTEIDYERLGRQVASHVLDALNRAEFGNQLADRVAGTVSQRLQLEFEPVSAQGWHQEFVEPPWSGHCWFGEHERCDGRAVPSERGCHCPHHRGEPIRELGYQLVLVERPEPADHPIGEPPAEVSDEHYDRDDPAGGAA